MVYSATGNYTIRYSEIDRVSGALSTTTPGVIDPSEAVRLTIDVGFTPQVGTTVTYSPAIPLPGVGEVTGWAGGVMLHYGTGSTTGSFGADAAAPGFMYTGAVPSLGGLPFGAAAASSGPQNSSNPVEGFVSFTWWPASYMPRVVSFRLADIMEPAQFIMLQVVPPGQQPTLLACYVNGVTYGQTGPITIVPAPGSLALVAAAGWRACRRSRG